MSERERRRVKPTSDSSDPESTSEASDGESSLPPNPNWKLARTPKRFRRVREVESEEDEPRRATSRQQSPPQDNAIDMDWALIKTPTTREEDLRTLNRYNSLPYLDPNQIKNAVFLLAKTYTPTTESIRYSFKEKRKDFLAAEEAHSPPIGTLKIKPHSRKLEFFVNLIVQYTGREAMNKLKEIMTAAILGNAEPNDSFSSLYNEMQGDPGRHTTSEIKKRKARLTCSKYPGEHPTLYGMRVPQTWWDAVGKPCRRCSGHMIVQKLEGLHYWYTVQAPSPR